jgi:hypothetical protein
LAADSRFPGGADRGRRLWAPLPPVKVLRGLIDLIQAPVGSLVEEIGGTRLVQADLTIGGEILVLLHSQYPQPFGCVDGIVLPGT